MAGEEPEAQWRLALLGKESARMDAWEGMSAFAALPKREWTRSLKRAAETGAEDHLERELHKQGRRYAPWYRFHFPYHYYYDLLVGLDFMTAFGFVDDRRLRYAISLLKDKRRGDGRWNLDAVHPDVDGGMAKWFNAHPTRNDAVRPRESRRAKQDDNVEGDDCHEEARRVGTSIATQWRPSC